MRMNKKRNRKENILKFFMPGIIAWIFISLFIIITMICNQYLLYLPSIICVSILLSFLFYLYLYGALNSFMKEKAQANRRKIIFITVISIEIIIMIGLIIYATFATLIIQEYILKALAIGGCSILLVLMFVTDLIIKSKK